LRQSEITLADASATRELGRRLAQIVRADAGAPTYIALSGELGSGKTTLVAGMINALGHTGPVRSPTYTLVEPYGFDGRELLHCDLYRLESPDALDELGLRDVLTAGNVLLVEWPERAGDRLGAADLAITLTYASTGAGTSADVGAGAGRHARLTAQTPRGAKLLSALDAIL
jgi:tRNA threonylcarbamoyladenosine biosynthesis protein TsaE